VEREVSEWKDLVVDDRVHLVFQSAGVSVVRELDPEGVRVRLKKMKEARMPFFEAVEEKREGPIVMLYRHIYMYIDIAL